MIIGEDDVEPVEKAFDVAVVAVGFERRCRWVVRKHRVHATKGIGLEFGFLAQGSYPENRDFFVNRNYDLIHGLSSDAPNLIAQHIRSVEVAERRKSIFVDISSMSRQMVANVILAIQIASTDMPIKVTAAYAPSKFARSAEQAPIRVAGPMKPALAGWTSMPEKPLGAVFGLGAEEGLALGALQTLEPDKAWVFAPKGIDERYDRAMTKANQHLADIFEVSRFEYDITKPTATRARLEFLLNSIDGYFRVVTVPFGPKIFSWLSLSTVILNRRSEVGLWAFSSKEHAKVVDRRADGQVIWHTMTLEG